jgi:hypothetical protein
MWTKEDSAAAVRKIDSLLTRPRVIKRDVLFVAKWQQDGSPASLLYAYSPGDRYGTRYVMPSSTALGAREALRAMRATLDAHASS